MAKQKRKVRVSAILILIAVLGLGIFGIYKIVDFAKGDKEEQTTPKEEETAEATEEPEEKEEDTEEPIAPIEEVDPEEDPRFFELDSYLLLANKKHPLPIDYVPSDLRLPNVEMRYNQWELRDEAATALEEMFKKADEEGVHLVCGSGYRSAEFQKVLYDNYVAANGVEAADTYSARPGYSDHQTGLATDLCGSDDTYDLSQAFEDTQEGIWLKDNAHKFGFIMRYPKGKDDITGYMYEPWHFRYIGVEEATKIYEKGEYYSFEEYYGVEGGGYAD